MSESKFIESLNLPVTLGVSSTTLSDQQRTHIENLIKQQHESTLDYRYEHRNHAIMRVALEDVRSNARRGFWFATIGMFALSGVFSSTRGTVRQAAVTKPHIYLPANFLIAGTLYWMWTAGAARQYNESARIVNRRISDQLNAMMDLQQE